MKFKSYLAEDTCGLFSDIMKAHIEIKDRVNAMKARVEKSGNGMRVDYYRVKDKETYRFLLLSSIFKDIEQDITMYIDTNQRLSDTNIEGFIDYLRNNGMALEEMSIPAKDVKMFGIAIGKLMNTKKKRKKETALVFEFNKELFTREVFDQYLQGVDVSIGIGRKKDFYDVCDKLFSDPDEVLFNADYFQDFMYDSAVCSSLRSTLDVKKHVKEIRK